MKAAAIIVAAGSGKRFGSKTPKQFLSLKGIPVFLHSVLAFRKVKEIKQIIVVLPAARMNEYEKTAKRFGFTVVHGGEERHDSVKSGLSALDPSIDVVAIHDGARPLVSPALIRDCVRTAFTSGASLAAVQARDTIKISGNNMTVAKTLPRKTIWLAQTPQCFRKMTIINAYRKLKTDNITDDAQVVELVGGKLKIVPGEYSNIKITEKADLKAAELVLKRK